RGHTGIVTAPDSADHEIPTLVANFDSERPALAAKSPVAQIFYTAGRQRPAVGKDLLGHQTPGHVERMIHQIAADLTAAVGNPVRSSPPVLGHQQQPGRLDRVARDDERFGNDATAPRLWT